MWEMGGWKPMGLCGSLGQSEVVGVLVMIKNSGLFLMLVLSSHLHGAPVFIEKNDAPMIKGENGVYVQIITTGFNVGGLAYVADTETKLCMSKWIEKYGGGAPIVIDCSKLAQREEWKEVITWVADDN